MKKHIKNLLNLFLCSTLIISLFNVGIVKVSAEDPHQFSLQAYDWNAFDNDWEGSGTGDEILENGDVEPGRVIQLSIYYVPGANTEIAMQVGLKYDSSLVEPMYYEDELYVETDMSTTYQGGIWPAAGTSPSLKKQTNWQVLSNDYVQGSQINFIIQDSTNAKALENEGVLATVYFKIKDGATPGSVINFSFDDTYTKMNQNRPVSLSDLNLNVFGEMSTNTSLSSLSVFKGSTIYSLSPTFVAGNSDIKDFNVVVPYSTADVDIAATPTDSFSTMASGVGNNILNVGSNTINLIVQAQNGTQEIYKVNIYRLSNDATLKTMSLTNGVNIGTFSSSVTSYTASVPYSTNSTTISATQNYAKANIKSGTGLWSLTNTGSTVNTKNVVVEAENCNTSYSTVPGNSCTSKTYKIDVTRTAPSTNANLSYLTIDGVTVPNFESTKYTYTLDNVANSKTSINLNAIVEDTGKANIISSLGSIKLNVGDNKISVKVQAEDKSTKEYFINVRRLSNDSKLSKLDITSTPSGTLSPNFSSTFYNYYTYSVPSTVQNVNIAGTVNDTNATIVSGLGQYDVNNTSSVNILVQAEDGSTSTYVVKLVRNKSTNNNLNTLSIDGYTLNETFNSDKTLYTANVSGDVSKVSVSATVEDTGKATIVSGLGSHDLVIGNNTIQIRVEAENGSTKDYTITVNRAKKTISALTNIQLDNVSLVGFNETKLEYDLPTVPFSKDKINITAEKKDADSTVTGTGDISLKTGMNKLYVVVTAQDGITKTTYILNVEREKDTNAYLSDIKVDNKTLTDFNKTKFEYNLTVSNEKKSLNLALTKESSLSTYSISNNNNFSTTQNNIVTITVTSEAGNILLYKINVTREKSDDNYLKQISLSNGLLNPTFNKTITDYTVDVDRSITSVEITAVTEEAQATYSVSGPNTLVIGENTFKITVTSESGIDRIYNILVRRNPSNNNYLSNLTVDGETVLKFNKNTALYTLTVPSTKNSVILAATTEESHATMTGTGTFNLDTGVNTFPIVVTAEDGTERTYSLVFNKEKSNNSQLNSLSVKQSPISPSFSPTTLSYSTSVAYSITNVDIEAEASDSKSTVTGTGNKTLNTGLNTFEIIVTSENNTSTKYMVNVTRAKNDNANLSNIVISGGFNLTPTFDSDTTKYSLSVPNATESLNITAYKQDPAALSVTGTGLVSLKTGVNTINIVVTAENGIAKKTYTLDVTREKSSDATLSNIVPASGTLNPTFNKDTKNYEVIVPYEIDNLRLTATTTSDAATVTIAGNDKLMVGTNEATITVTAEDGTIYVYKVNILRQPSTNNFLSSLSVKDSNLVEYIDTFVKTKLEYNINVENNIESINLDAISDDSTSTVTGAGQKTLDIGSNELNIIVKSASGVERTYKVNIFRKANSNSYLSKLEVEGQTFETAFNKNNLSYTVNVDSLVDKIKINAEAEVETSSVTGAGEFDLKTGVNSFSIDVQAEDGSIKTYVIVVNKNASNNNYLSNLVVANYQIIPEFNKETLKYSLHLDNAISTIDISASSEHSAATITGTGLKSVNVGTTNFPIVVKAENNEIRTYTLTVNRDASSNNDLSNLLINNNPVENFDSKILKYSLDVDNSVKSIDISAILSDSTAAITGIGKIDLSTGLNKIPVTVTAENGAIKIYELGVTRAKSSNNYLSNLNITEGSLSPEFNKETITYSVSVPYEVDKLTINAIKEDQASTIEIDSNNNFVVGLNEVYINVIAENGNIKTYKLNITRQPQANNFLTDIAISDNSGVKYSLDPIFNKTTYNYNVELPSTSSSVNIAVQKEAMSLSVEGDGDVQITSLPQTQKIVVKTTGGLERTYTINFVKGLSSNANLKSLEVSDGELSPAFDKDEVAYNVDLDSGTKEITISAIKDDESQNVTGLGKHSLTTGRNTIKVTVTSENGNFKIYTIFVNVKSVTGNVLSSLSVDKGNLSPVFDENTRLYSVDLDENQENITISATGINTITGTGLHSLELGANVFEICSIDSTGAKNIYRVVVNRGSIVSSKLKYLAIDNYFLNETFNEDNYSYTSSIFKYVSDLSVIAIPKDKNATVSIKGNKDLKAGNNIITIDVTDETGSNSQYIINLTLGLNKITSSIHEVGDKYIQTIVSGETAAKVKEEMTNPKENLKIYDTSGKEVNDSDLVATSYTIKLIINGTVSDTKTLIIKGDINEDGDVGVSDIIKLRTYILGNVNLNTDEMYASDVNNDSDVGVADLIKIRSHILGNANIFAGKED